MSILKTLTINGIKYNVAPIVPADTVTLYASAWEGSGEVYSQVITVPGATARTKVDLQPTPEQLAEFHYKILAFVAENDGGVVTVYSIGDKPTGDHTIQITKTEVEGTGKVRGNTVGTTMPSVLYTEQNLSEAEKAVVRRNIGLNDLKRPAVLAIGDSICAGDLNEGRGFVGDLGVPYINKGVNGAAFTRIVPGMIDDQVIVNQLIKAHENGVQADIIIADGGANDYKFGGDLESTLSGVEDLFSEMQTRYPRARKFFLLMHKTKSLVAKGAESAIYDWTSTANLAGYTQTQLFDAIKELCEVYEIEVIDVFGESELDTNDPKYVSEYVKAEYENDDFYRLTANDWVANDGLHPLAYGYAHGYLPIVHKAIFGSAVGDEGGCENNIFTGDTQPEGMKDGDIWIDTSEKASVPFVTVPQMEKYVADAIASIEAAEEVSY